MTLFTLGHGTVEPEIVCAQLSAAGVQTVVDVRRFPGSRRWPWFAGDAMRDWLGACGVAYRWAPDLGGRRTPLPDSPNIVLRERGFRGYADYMATPEFAAAFGALLSTAASKPTAILCSETLWWRCHRRLIADAAELVASATVVHLIAQKQAPHRVTEGARLARDHVVYDGAAG